MRAIFISYRRFLKGNNIDSYPVTCPNGSSVSTLKTMRTARLALDYPDTRKKRIGPSEAEGSRSQAGFFRDSSGD